MLLALVIARVPLGGALGAVAGIPAVVIAAALALYFAALAVNAARLLVFLPELSFFQAWRFTMIGVLYGIALPGQVAGDAVKAARLARLGAGGGGAAAIAAVVTDKAVGVFALLLLAAMGLGLNPGRFGAPIMLAAGAMVFAAAVGLFIALRAPLPRWLGRWGEAIAAWRTASIRPRTLIAALALGLLFHAMTTGVFALLGANLGIDLSFPEWAVVFGLVSFVLLMPITIAGIGLREGALVGVLGYLGQSDVAALALSLALLVLSLSGAALGFVADLAGRDRI